MGLTRAERPGVRLGRTRPDPNSISQVPCQGYVTRRTSTISLAVFPNYGNHHCVVQQPGSHYPLDGHSKDHSQRRRDMAGRDPSVSCNVDADTSKVPESASSMRKSFISATEPRIPPNQEFWRTRISLDLLRVPELKAFPRDGSRSWDANVFKVKPFSRFPNGEPPGFIFTGRKRDLEVFDDPDEIARRKLRAKAKRSSHRPIVPPERDICWVCQVGRHSALRCMQTWSDMGMTTVCPIHPDQKDHVLDDCYELLVYLSSRSLQERICHLMCSERKRCPQSSRS